MLQNMRKFNVWCGRSVSQLCANTDVLSVLKISKRQGVHNRRMYFYFGRSSRALIK